MKAFAAAQAIAAQLNKTGYVEVYGEAKAIDNWDDNGNPVVTWNAPGWAMNDRYELFAEAAAEMSAMGLEPGDYSQQKEKTWFNVPKGVWAEPYTPSILVIGQE